MSSRVQFHQTEIKTDLPALVGPAALAWRLPLPEKRARPDHEASLGCYLIQCPGLHVAWDLYLLSAIHLRDIVGAPPARKTSPEVTHEFVVFAIDPKPGPLDPLSLVAPDGYRPLLPINVSVQIDLGPAPAVATAASFQVADELAVRILGGLARCVIAGQLIVEPEGFKGASQLWEDLIKNTAQHLTQGFCPGSVQDETEGAKPS